MTAPKSTTLKPCPWCGEIPAISPFPGRYWVECQNHDCDVLTATKEFNRINSAIDAWNRRNGEAK